MPTGLGVGTDGEHGNGDALAAALGDLERLFPALSPRRARYDDELAGIDFPLLAVLAHRQLFAVDGDRQAGDDGVLGNLDLELGHLEVELLPAHLRGRDAVVAPFLLIEIGSDAVHAVGAADLSFLVAADGEIERGRAARIEHEALVQLRTGFAVLLIAHQILGLAGEGGRFGGIVLRERDGGRRDGKRDRQTNNAKPGCRAGGASHDPRQPSTAIPGKEVSAQNVEPSMRRGGVRVCA